MRYEVFRVMKDVVQFVIGVVCYVVASVSEELRLPSSLFTEAAQFEVRTVLDRSSSENAGSNLSWVMDVRVLLRFVVLSRLGETLRWPLG
jgi:hypothetical protein